MVDRWALSCLQKRRRIAGGEGLELGRRAEAVGEIMRPANGMEKWLVVEEDVPGSRSRVR